MNSLPGTISYPVIKIDGKNNRIIRVDDPVIEEITLALFLNGQELVIMSASAGEEEFLAVGFLAAEGIIKEAGEIKSIEADRINGIIRVETYKIETLPEKLFLKRRLSACRGKGRNEFSFTGDDSSIKKTTGSVFLSPREIMAYSQMLEDNSGLFHTTGGVHGGALAENGRFILHSFDVGRHNVFDKIYGRCLLEGIPAHNKTMVFTGRVSTEIIIKLSKMNIPVIIACSAPTSLALDMAEALDITVVGFARGERMNIYTHPHRVLTRIFNADSTEEAH